MKSAFFFSLHRNNNNNNNNNFDDGERAAFHIVELSLRRSQRFFWA
jgi:hypothetical protein